MNAVSPRTPHLLPLPALMALLALWACSPAPQLGANAAVPQPTLAASSTADDASSAGTSNAGTSNATAAPAATDDAAATAASTEIGSTDTADNASRPSQRNQQTGMPHAVLPDGFEVTVEVAVTDEERRLGLMFRPSLPESRGMLFRFERRGILSIWMKNTYVPLDIVFLDERGVVVDISANAVPCKADPCPHYTPRKPANAVLELAAGTAAHHGLGPGSVIAFTGVSGYPAAADAGTGERQGG